MSEKDLDNQDIEEVKENLPQYPFSVVVRFRETSKPYSFGAFDSNVQKGDYVVVETAQGLELAQAESDAMNIEKYGLSMPEKPVVRIASDDDLDDYAENEELEKDAFDVCQEEIELLGLDMSLLSAQYTLDRSKVLFIYVADQRVDFRELLKHLGSRLHCRIELRQIGERDKAKMVGGIGVCGMECCCRRFKEHFDVISINMAKNQLLALNTEKLSGMCGKLMCCLKYEDDDYKEVIDGLPKMGSQVEYEGEIYRITNMNIMSEEAKLENFESVVFLTLKELKEKAIPRKGIAMQRKTDSDEKRVIYRLDNNHEEEDTVKHVSMELPTMFTDEEKEEPKQEVQQNNNNKKRENRRERRPKQNTQEQDEVKNVTVRTFGKKKKNEDNS